MITEKNDIEHIEHLAYDDMSGNITIKDVSILINGVVLDRWSHSPRKSPITITLTDGRKIEMLLGEAEAIGQCDIVRNRLMEM